MSNTDIFSKLIREDLDRMFRTVGQPAPNTVTRINSAEIAIGFTPVAPNPSSKKQKKPSCKGPSFRR